MALPTGSLVYNQAGYEVLDRNAGNTINLESVTLKVMLVNTTYDETDDDAHKDVEVVDAGGASDLLDGEVSVTNYTGGYGGAGRLTLANGTFGSGPDDANNRTEFDADDVDWGTLGNGSNDTIVGAAIIIEDHLGATGDDTETRAVAWIDLADTTTNGTGFQIQWSAEGIIHWTN